MYLIISVRFRVDNPEMITLNYDDKHTPAIYPLTKNKFSLLPKCDGQLYTVKAGDTLFSISRNFGMTIDEILAANPQIKKRSIIYIGQFICIPSATPNPIPDCDLRILTLKFLTEDGRILPEVNGTVALAAGVIVRITLNRPISQAFFFLEPTGTETCELAHLIGIDCPSAVTGVAEIQWQVPSGTLGRVFVVACLNNCCTKSEEILVIRDT